MHLMNGTHTGAPKLTLLAHDARSESFVRHAKRFRILHRPTRQTAGRARNIFVLVPASALPEVAEFVSVANRRHQLRALLIRDDVRPSAVPQMFERAGLRLMRNTIVHSDPDVPSRVLTAWAHDAQDELLAKASVSDDRLFVLSCALQPYEIGFDQMAALKRIPAAERSNFVLDEDGSYIHWPAPGIHVDLDAIRTALDPRLRTKTAAEKILHDCKYGVAIARVRSEHGLRQSGITGLSERQVRRIEKGGRTTIEALRRLASAHRMDLDAYLNELAANIPDSTPKKRLR